MVNNQMNTKQIVAADADIVIGILARDCAQALQGNIPAVEELGSYFKNYHIVIYENDSIDETKKILIEWRQHNPKVILVMENHQARVSIPQEDNPYPDKSIYRIQRMINCRNRLLEETRKLPAPDLWCLIDIDIEYFNPRSVVDAIERAPADWGGLFANGAIYMQYSDHVQPDFIQRDSYAYVDEGVDPLKSKCWGIDHNYHQITGARMTWKLRKHPFLSCYSAFNGIGVYKWEAIKDETYRIMQTPELKAVHASFCEHVPFNLGVIQKGYRNYIAREMKVIYWLEYPKEKTGLSNWQNYHRAIYYYQGRPLRLMKTIFHMLKERLNLFPYQH